MVVWVEQETDSRGEASTRSPREDGGTPSAARGTATAMLPSIVRDIGRIAASQAILALEDRTSADKSGPNGMKPVLNGPADGPTLRDCVS